MGEGIKIINLLQISKFMTQRTLSHTNTKNMRTCNDAGQKIDSLNWQHNF